MAEDEEFARRRHLAYERSHRAAAAALEALRNTRKQDGNHGEAKTVEVKR